MQDTELYRYLLGIEAPWTVKKVQLDLVNQRVDVWADHAEDLRWLSRMWDLGSFVRSCCGAGLASSGQLPIYDLSSCSSSEDQLSGTWGSTGPIALGGGQGSIHPAL